MYSLETPDVECFDFSCLILIKHDSWCRLVSGKDMIVSMLFMWITLHCSLVRFVNCEVLRSHLEFYNMEAWSLSMSGDHGRCLQAIAPLLAVDLFLDQFVSICYSWPVLLCIITPECLLSTLSRS
jgi:hypothetical protein